MYFGIKQNCIKKYRDWGGRILPLSLHVYEINVILFSHDSAFWN